HREDGGEAPELALRSDHLSAPFSAEGESIGLHAGVEELDLEGPVRDRAALPDELVEPLPGHGSLAIGVDVGAMAVAGRGAVDGDAEAYRLAVRARSQDKMEVAGMKAIDDAAVLRIEDGMLAADGPVARQSPFVEARRPGRIDMTRILDRATGGDEVLRP